MAISRTPALFVGVDLFSRSRVIICYLREIIFSCRRKRHWKWQKHCKLCASCNFCHVWQMVYLISLARKLKSYNQGFCRLCKLVDIHLYFTAWAWNRPWIFQDLGSDDAKTRCAGFVLETCKFTLKCVPLWRPMKPFPDQRSQEDNTTFPHFPLQPVLSIA